MGIYDFLSDPSMAALLGGSAAMLQASGPSPYPNRFGPALGAGVLGGMQAGQQAQSYKLRDALMAAQVQQAQRTQAMAESAFRMLQDPSVHPYLAEQSQGALGPGLQPQ